MRTKTLLDRQLQLATLLASAHPDNLDDVSARAERLSELLAHLHEFLEPVYEPVDEPESLHEAALHALYEGTVHWVRRGHYRAGVVPNNDIVIIARKPRGFPADLQVERLSAWLDEVRTTCLGQSATATLLRELANEVEKHVADAGNLYQRITADWK